MSTRVKNVDIFHKSNSLDSGYKTLSAASHGTSHTDPIDEVNEQFLQIGSSPSSCSSSSFAVSNSNVIDPKITSKIDFIVDDDDLNNKDSKSNIESKDLTKNVKKFRQIIFI